jgi:hypothetical protein
MTAMGQGQQKASQANPNSDEILSLLRQQVDILKRQTRYFLILVIAALVFLGLCVLVIAVNNKYVSDFASNFVSEQLAARNVEDYEVAHVYVPWRSFFLSRYDVHVLLRNKNNSDDIRILEATITGRCLTGDCVMQTRPSSMFGL